MQTAQLLMILGETQAERRLAEDERDTLREQVEILTTMTEELKKENERLQSEKGVILADKNDLENEIERMKGGVSE